MCLRRISVLSRYTPRFLISQVKCFNGQFKFRDDGRISFTLEKAAVYLLELNSFSKVSVCVTKRMIVVDPYQCCTS